jgi:hypothetical protein
MEDFLNLVKNANKLSRQDFLIQLKQLLHGKEHLILGFNVFLPTGMSLGYNRQKEIDLFNTLPGQTAHKTTSKSVSSSNKDRLSEALSFMSKVKTAFSSEPHHYHEFVETVRACKAQNLDSLKVINKLKDILAGKPELILGLNCVLPDGLCIVQTDGGFTAVQKIPSPAHSKPKIMNLASISHICVVCERNCLQSNDIYMRCSGCAELVHTSCCDPATVEHPVMVPNFFANFLCPFCMKTIAASDQIQTHLGQPRDSFKVLHEVSALQRFRMSLTIEKKSHARSEKQNEIVRVFYTLHTH